MNALEIFALVIVGLVILSVIRVYRNDRRQDWDAMYEKEFIKNYLKGK
jgi:hypothetical protein